MTPGEEEGEDNLARISTNNCQSSDYTGTSITQTLRAVYLPQGMKCFTNVTAMMKVGGHDEKEGVCIVISNSLSSNFGKIYEILVT